MWLGCPLALPVQAFACPTAADMERGVVFYLDDGSTQVHRSAPDGFVIVDVTYDTGERAQNVFHYGVFIQSLTPIEDGVVRMSDAWTYAYRSKPPFPEPNSTGQLVAATGSRDAGYSDETQKFVWGAPTMMRLGSCRYQVIQGQFHYDGSNYQAEETINFLPELGTGILTRYSDESGATDTYKVDRIVAR